MSLSKETYDKARKNAKIRLEGWINSIKEVNEPERSGIPRLQNEFRSVFKKIEWKPRHMRTLERKSKKAHSRDASFRNTRADSITKVGGGPSGPLVGSPTRTPVLRALDSNSSNLSYRQEHRDEIVGGEITDRTSALGYPRAPTCIICAPYSRAEGDALEDDIQDNVEVADALDRLSPENIESSKNLALIRSVVGRRGRRGTTIEYDNALNPIFKFRRRRQLKKEVDAMKVETTNHAAESECEETVGLLVPEGLENKKVRVDSSVGPVGSRPQSPSTNFKVSFKRGGAPIEVVFKRTTKGGKAAKAVFNKPSVPEIINRQPASEERKAVILAKFRRVVRLLTHVRVLLNVSRLRIEEEEKTKAFRRIDGDFEKLFDPDMYKKAFSGGLTERIRRALKKNPEERSQEDARTLMVINL